MDLRDFLVDFVREWKAKTGLSQAFLLQQLDISNSKFADWKKRYGCVNHHNGPVPRDYWLEDWEIQAIVDFFIEHPDVGYRRLTYRMMDKDLVAVSPSTTYNVLKKNGLMGKREVKKSTKGTGFKQPERPHAHWHIDISYLNISGTFYYMCSVVDGFSRAIIHFEIRERMTEQDVEIILQRALERFPDVHPRIISDNGPQFIAKDFKEFVRTKGMTHVRTSPYYPQSNGKLERYHKTVKTGCIRPNPPKSLDDARIKVSQFVQNYNRERLHSGIGYIAPWDKLMGRAKVIFQSREDKLDRARTRRREKAKLTRSVA